MNLKELSQILGLSQTTVSRALNGYPEVNETTRARVASAAKTYGYSPNVRAKGLATGQAMAIAHALHVSGRDEIMNPIFADFVAGASEVYSARGYDMMLTIVEDSEGPEALRNLARKGSVDGVIVQAPRFHEPRLDLLRETGLPFVVHGRTSEPEDSYSWIDMDNRRAFLRATEFLADLGHTRIALINGDEQMDFARRRRIGYETALTRRGILPDPTLMTTGAMTEVYGYESARRCLETLDRPTAFLVASLISALGVRRAIEDAGLRIARDVSVITHDDDLSYLRNGDATPIFTATRSPVRLAGRKAAELLLKLIEGRDSAPSNELLYADLTVGRSTGPARAPELIQP
ncbi:MAG: LacI family DNA-binding transcriptional regulator [Pseudomonadota bacterium]